MRKQKQFAIAMVAIMLLSVLILTVPIVMSGDENATLGDENVTNLTNVNKTNETIIEETATKEAMPPFPHDQAFRSMLGQHRPPFPRSLEEEKEFAEKRGQIPPIHGLEKNGECTYFRFTGNVKQLWDESHEGVDWTQAYPAGDLDGDGKEDVLVQTSEYVWATDTRTATVIAKRGYDGTHLWSESISVTDGYCWINAIPAGDLDGDGKDDVIVSSSKYENATDIRTAEVIAKKGETGVHLWEESGIYADSAGDLNGDGKDDVLVQTSEYDWATDTRTETMIAKRGYDGVHLWEESVSCKDWNCWIDAYSAGDLNGDGKDDVLVHTYEYDEATDTKTEKVIAKKGENGAHLWEESVSCADWNRWIDAYSAGDLNGDGKDDVLVHTYEYDEATDTKT
ncbi:MAG: VCBS repeat-containing protein, partial [Methanophagales archaeon]|nr:VCBS repeat-containing protein [Methanophagales archaeon]